MAEALLVLVHLAGEIIEQLAFVVGQQVDAALAFVELDLGKHGEHGAGAVGVAEARGHADVVQAPHDVHHPEHLEPVQGVVVQDAVAFQEVRGLDAARVEVAFGRDVQILHHLQHGRFHAAVDDLVGALAGDAQHQALAVQLDVVGIVGQALELFGHLGLGALVGQFVGRQQAQGKGVAQAVYLAEQHLHPGGVDGHAVQDADDGILPVIVRAALVQFLADEGRGLLGPVGDAGHAVARGRVLAHGHHAVAGIGDQFPLAALLGLLADELRDPGAHQGHHRAADVGVTVDDQTVAQTVGHQLEGGIVVGRGVLRRDDELDAVLVHEIVEAFVLVTDHQGDVGDAVGMELADGAFHQRIAADVEQGLGLQIGEGAQTRPEAGTKNVGTHGNHSCALCGDVADIRAAGEGAALGQESPRSRMPHPGCGGFSRQAKKGKGCPVVAAGRVRAGRVRETARSMLYR